MNRILLFVIVICLSNVLLFFFVPNSFPYIFNLESFLREPWRLFTFQFFHVNIFHLLENVIGFIFIALIAAELEIDLKSFLFIYFLATFVVVLPMALAFPLTTVAGNSTGIYGILALCLVKARKLVSVKITIPLIIILIFYLSIFNFILCGICFVSSFKSGFLHFIGFLSGITLSFVPKAKTKHLLRM